MARDRLLECHTTHPFDAVAPRYDTTFTEQDLGRWLRERVWQQLASTFQAGEQVLDLGCGTGEDAIWLAQHDVQVRALDASAGMLTVAESKARQSGVIDRITFAQVDIGKLEVAEAALGGRAWPIPSDGAFDGAISNFGPINCLKDRQALASTLSRLIRPGGRLVLGVMGPLCPWEIGWYLSHGHPRTALRRLRAGAPARVGEDSLKVWYPSPRRLRSEFFAGFRHIETIGLGVVLPPTELGHLIPRAPRLFAALRELDARLGRTKVAPWLSDHYLSIFERRSAWPPSGGDVRDYS